MINLNETNKVAIKIEDAESLELFLDEKINEYDFKLAKINNNPCVFISENNNTIIGEFNTIGFLDNSKKNSESYIDPEVIDEELKENQDDDTRDTWDLKFDTTGYASTEHKHLLAIFTVTNTESNKEENIKQEIVNENTEEIDLAIKRVVDEGILSHNECIERYDLCKELNVKYQDIIALFNSMKKYDRMIMKPNVLFTDNNMSKIIYRLLKGRNLAFSGPAGTGKNTCVDTLSWLVNRPMRVISCHSQIDIEAFFGKDSFKSTIDEETGKPLSMETAFQKGQVLKAMENGEILVLDEVNTINPSIIPSLNSILDYRGTVEIPDVGIVKSDENFITIATFNRDYEGTGKIQEAFSSRLFHVDFQWLDSIENVLKLNVPNYNQEIVELVDRVYKNLLQNVRSKDLSNQIEASSLCMRSLIRACEALCDRDFDKRESLIEDLVPNAADDEDKVKIIAAIDNALRLEK